MTNDELNRYILHYLTEDKTKSAIMLTGDWGTGKSYYIQNELKPFLEKEENGKHQCIIVSLYGLKGIDEISKSIYLEDKTEKLNVSSQTLTAGKILAKTIIKNFAGHYGVDLSMSDADLNKLYASVDLSGKLVVLEDLERSSIDILEVLGYVNNLVEQDGVKVLLVSNEDEIIRYTSSDGKTLSKKEYNESATIMWLKNAAGLSPKGDEKTEYFPTYNTEQYFKIKEKTISDTIQYICPIEKSLEEIICDFDMVCYRQVLEKKDDTGTPTFVGEITSLMRHSCFQASNLRSVIYALQKTSAMIAMYNANVGLEFIKHILLGNIAFALKKKANASLLLDDWCAELNRAGLSKYSIEDVCYVYFTTHQFDANKFRQAESDFYAREEARKTTQETYQVLNTIYKFKYQSEESVRAAVQKVVELLQQDNAISPYEFSCLANYLVKIHGIIGCSDDLERCKYLMICNIENADCDADTVRRIKSGLTHFDGITLCDDEQKADFADWQNAMLNVAEGLFKKDFDFEYSGEGIKKLHKAYLHDADFLRGKGTFATLFDVQKLIQLLEQCSNEALDEFRAVFIGMYERDNGSLAEVDMKALLEIKESVTRYIDEHEKSSDKIHLWHMRLFVANIQDIVSPV